MLLGRVIGQVVPAVAYEGLSGVPMLYVQPLDKHGEPKGAPLVAADSTRMAGPGELVYYEGGREAALALDPWFVPIDHTIVGIVDGFSTGPGTRDPGPGLSPNPRSRIPDPGYTYFVSRCTVCVRQNGQYFFISRRSVVVFLFFVVL